MGMEGFNSGSEKIVGAKQNADGTLDTSKAMRMIDSDVEEKPPKLTAEAQREKIIEGKIKAQREANPNSVIIVEQARKYWGKLYDNASPGMRMDSQVEESYATRYEKGLIWMRKEMLNLEAQLNKTQTESERQKLLKSIADLRNNIGEQEMVISERRARKNI